MHQDNQLVEKLTKEIKEDYIEDMGDIYPDKNGQCRLYNLFLLDTKKFVSDNRPIYMVFDTLENISYWHLGVSQYKIMIGEDKEALKEFISSLSYGYLYMKKNYEAWECLRAEEVIEMDAATMLLSLNIISYWWEESSEIAESMIESINFVKRHSKERDKLIGTGTDKSTVSWFILELYSKVINKEINHKNASYLTQMKLYTKVLEKWDTKDVTEVQHLVQLLAEYHLKQVIQLEGTDRYYYEFGDDFKWLFPYEILVWLKLREKAGLKNPKTFTHPLMNTPIAKMFLDIKEPLPKPTELPYAKELLAKLKEKCPNVEIPEWLEGNIESVQTVPTHKEEDSKVLNDIIPDDFFKESIN